MATNRELIEKLMGAKKYTLACTHLIPLPGSPAYDREGGMKKIIDQENPYIPAIHPEAVKNSMSGQNTSLPYLIQKYLSQKESIIKYINNVPFFYWDRTGVHELEGHVTFEEFVRRLIKNDNSNIAALKKK